MTLALGMDRSPLEGSSAERGKVDNIPCAAEGSKQGAATALAKDLVGPGFSRFRDVAKRALGP